MDKCTKYSHNQGCTTIQRCSTRYAKQELYTWLRTRNIHVPVYFNAPAWNSDGSTSFLAKGIDSDFVTFRIRTCTVHVSGFWAMAIEKKLRVKQIDYTFQYILFAGICVCVVQHASILYSPSLCLAIKLFQNWTFFNAPCIWLELTFLLRIYPDWIVVMKKEIQLLSACRLKVIKVS